MDILCGAILTDHGGDIAAYWDVNQHDLLIERALEDLVVGQFDRLEQLDPDAYKLLCRMGCYRYQDVPTVPIDGLLCLLWDVAENRQRRVVKALQERSLVDYEDGEFWLHPVIREEAIGRLRASENWEVSNREAAHFWTEAVKSVETVEDALRALEPYYHYLEVSDFSRAGNVILQERENSWSKKFLPKDLSNELKHSSLGASLSRLGLFEQTISVINRVIADIELSPSVAGLYYRLGALYLSLGQIRKAIECTEKTKEIAISFSMERLENGALIQIGYCKIDLLEIEEAFQIFSKISLNLNTSYRRSIPAWARLALLHSYLGQEKEAVEFADKVCNELTGKYIGLRGRAYVLFILGIVYKNLGEFQKSIEFYNAAISYSEEIHFAQLKAQALTGIAEIQRELKNLNLAFVYHLESMQILKAIGAKSGLAEACYQIALSYGIIGEIEQSNEKFQEAIRLFDDMEAPKQVERVKRSMNGKT